MADERVEGEAAPSAMAIPTLEELEAMTPEELEEFLDAGPKVDIPRAARRSLARLGVIAPDEGGLPTLALRRQSGQLVRAALANTRGPLVSRWGHILLRRALASRLAPPRDMDALEFARLRVEALNSMGEYALARAILQEIDTDRWDRRLLAPALQSYLGSFDLLGLCPAVLRLGANWGGGQERAAAAGEAAQRWAMVSAICEAYRGRAAFAQNRLNRLLANGKSDAIDVLLAQRYAGAAGEGRRAVEIEWDEVDRLTPWSFSLALAVGETIPERLIEGLGPWYRRAAATAPMLAPRARHDHALFAAAEGVLSARALVDLYSAIHAVSVEADEDPVGEIAQRLREAYVARDPEERIAAMRAIWGEARNRADYARQIATAYAAARIEPSQAFAGDAEALIASMLTAGLDRDAAAWARVVEPGGRAWAMIALAQASDAAVDNGALDHFLDEDDSADRRRSRFLVAALAGLGRIARDDLAAAASRLDLDLTRQTRWTRKIAASARVKNPALVAFLAGLGMQGRDWTQMTPLHLYHITRSLRLVGLEAEARMIAAEAIARG